MSDSLMWKNMDGLPEEYKDDFEEVYQHSLDYVNHFLVSSHPFRKGAVCPFVPNAIKEEAVYFSAVKSTLNDDAKVLSVKVNNIIESYTKVKSNHSDNSSCMVIMFNKKELIPRLFRVHKKLKRKALAREVMIGFTYDVSHAPSLHKSGYYPLRTQYPCFILRDLTPFDLVFLTQENVNLLNKIFFLNIFLRKFKARSVRSTVEAVKKAKQLRLKYAIRLVTYFMSAPVLTLIAVSMISQ